MAPSSGRVDKFFELVSQASPRRCLDADSLFNHLLRKQASLLSKLRNQGILLVRYQVIPCKLALIEFVFDEFEQALDPETVLR